MPLTFVTRTLTLQNILEEIKTRKLVHHAGFELMEDVVDPANAMFVMLIARPCTIANNATRTVEVQKHGRTIMVWGAVNLLLNAHQFACVLNVHTITTRI